MRQRRGIVPGRPKCLAQFSLEYMATRLSGYVKRARGYPLLAQSRHKLVQRTCPVWVIVLRQRALPRKLNSAALCVLLLPGRRRHQVRNHCHRTLGIAVHRPCLFRRHHHRCSLDRFSRVRLMGCLSLPKIKSVRIDGAAVQERASLGCARCVE
jgi:hypothetical protein